MTPLSGGCLCGAARFEADALPLSVINCHCTMCRKHSGAAFLTYALFNASDVRFSGPALIAYRSSAAARRTHCGTCGSPLGFHYDGEPGSNYLTIGSFDDAALLAPAADWFVSAKLAWVHLDAQLEQWPELPPG